jgi:hypothetical protein
MIRYMDLFSESLGSCVEDMIRFPKLLLLRCDGPTEF